MRSLVVSLVALLVAIPCCRDSSSGSAPESSMIEFSAGQTWQYKTRPGEEASRLVVCRVDADRKLGTIVHVYVEGVAIKSPRAQGGVTRVVHHLPFAAEALRNSVGAPGAHRDDLPDYQDGYDTWRQAFDSGKAGVFTISVAESLDFMEQAIGK